MSEEFDQPPDTSFWAFVQDLASAPASGAEEEEEMLEERNHLDTLVEPSKQPSPQPNQNATNNSLTLPQITPIPSQLKRDSGSKKVTVLSIPFPTSSGSLDQSLNLQTSQPTFSSEPTIKPLTRTSLNSARKSAYLKRRSLEGFPTDIIIPAPLLNTPAPIAATLPPNVEPVPLQPVDDSPSVLQTTTVTRPSLPVSPTVVAPIEDSPRFADLLGLFSSAQEKATVEPSSVPMRSLRESSVSPASKTQQPISNSPIPNPPSNIILNNATISSRIQTDPLPRAPKRPWHQRLYLNDGYRRVVKPMKTATPTRTFATSAPPMHAIVNFGQPEGGPSVEGSVGVKVVGASASGSFKWLRSSYRLR